MNWKEFFRPKIWVILLFIIIIFIAPIIGWQNFICEPCPPQQFKCAPCGEHQFEFFGITKLIYNSLTENNIFCCPLFTPKFVSITILLELIISYMAACLIVYPFSRKSQIFKT